MTKRPAEGQAIDVVMRDGETIECTTEFVKDWVFYGVQIYHNGLMIVEKDAVGWRPHNRESNYE